MQSFDLNGFNNGFGDEENRRNYMEAFEDSANFIRERLRKVRDSIKELEEEEDGLVKTLRHLCVTIDQLNTVRGWRFYE